MPHTRRHPSPGTCLLGGAEPVGLGLAEGHDLLQLPLPQPAQSGWADVDVGELPCNQWKHIITDGNCGQREELKMVRRTREEASGEDGPLVGVSFCSALSSSELSLLPR